MNQLSNKPTDSELADENPGASCVCHKFCSYHELLGHLHRRHQPGHQTSGGPATREQPDSSPGHVHRPESRVCRPLRRPTPNTHPLNGFLLLLVSLTLHLLLWGSKCGCGVVVVGQMSSTAANAASAAATLLVVRGLEPTPSGVAGLQRYSLSFEPVPAPKHTVSAAPNREPAKTDKIGASLTPAPAANRRNFGDKLPGYLIEHALSKLNQVTAAPQNSTDDSPTAAGGPKGKLDLFTRMLKYRLPRSNPLLGSWMQRAGSNSSNTTGSPEKLVSGEVDVGQESPVMLNPSSSRPDELSRTIVDWPADVLLAVNASTRDYQVVKVAGSGQRAKNREHSPRLDIDRSSSSGGRGRDSDAADSEGWRHDKGFWKAHTGGHEQSSLQGSRGSGGARDAAAEVGHLRHGWKNVFHREELKDKQRYRDAVHRKDWPAGAGASNSSTGPKSNRSRLRKHDNWGPDNHSYGSKYDFVKGTEWRRQEPEEVEPDCDSDAELDREASPPASSARHHGAKSGRRNHADTSSATDQHHHHVPSEPDRQEPDEETMDRIKRKLDRLESSMGLGEPAPRPRRPVTRVGRFNASSHQALDSQVAVGEVDYDEAWRNPEMSVPHQAAKSGLGSASHQRDSINEIIESAKGEQARNLSYPIQVAGGQMEASSSMEEGADEEEPGTETPDMSVQEEQPGKKNDQIRLKLELDLGKSVGDVGTEQQQQQQQQQVAAKSVLLKNISLPVGSSQYNYSRPLGAPRPAPATRYQVNFQKHFPANTYMAPHKPPVRHAAGLFKGPVKEWAVYSAGSQPFQFTSANNLSLSAEGARPARPLSTRMLVGPAEPAPRLVRNHRLPAGFAENQFAHLLPRRQPSYETEPFMEWFQRGSQEGWHQGGAQLRPPPQQPSGASSLASHDYRALDSGLSALTQILPNRPIFVKHLQMNGHLVAERVQEQPTSAQHHNRSTTSGPKLAGSSNTNHIHQPQPRPPSLSAPRPPPRPEPLQHSLDVVDEEADEEEPLFEGLNGSIGDTISIPGAHIESIEPPFHYHHHHHHQPPPHPPPQDYLMASANMRGRVKTEAGGSSFQELLGPHAADDSFLFGSGGSDFYPSQSAPDSDRMPGANFLSMDSGPGSGGPPPPLDLGFVASEAEAAAANQQLLATSSGHHHTHDRYPGAEPLLALLEPAGNRHPLVEVATHALAHPLKSLNYATALLINQQATAAHHPLAGVAGGLVLPAMQHTFGRLFKLPRVLAPSFVSKHQLMELLNMNLARHLTVPVPDGLLSSDSSSRWRQLIPGPALHALALVAPAGARPPLLEMQDLMDVSSSRLIASTNLKPAPGQLLLPAGLKVRARLQHVPTKVDSSGHLVAAVAQPGAKAAAPAGGAHKEAGWSRPRTPEARLKAWFSALSADSTAAGSVSQQHRHTPPSSQQKQQQQQQSGAPRHNGTGAGAGNATRAAAAVGTGSHGKPLAGPRHKLELKSKPVEPAGLLLSASDNKKVTNQQPGFTWFNIPYSAPANRHHQHHHNQSQSWPGSLKAEASTEAAPPTHHTTARPAASSTRRPPVPSTKEPHFGQRIILSFKSRFNTIAGG